jgi:hypothetical protein
MNGSDQASSEAVFDSQETLRMMHVSISEATNVASCENLNVSRPVDQ